MAKKAPDAFRTISEVSDALDTPAHVLRFWESKFSQVKPVKRAGGRRYYRPDDIDLLSGIKTLLHEQGMTIKGAQKLLREKGVKHVIAIAPIAGVPSDDASKAVDVTPPKSSTTAKRKEAPKTDEAVEITDLSRSQSKEVELPSLDIAGTDVEQGLLSLIVSKSSDDLVPRAAKLAPIVQRMEALHERMTAG